MKRAVASVMGLSILGVVSLAFAADPQFFKPSYQGKDNKLLPKKSDAMVVCTEKGFLLAAEKGLAFCHMEQTKVNTVGLKCQDGTRLVTDDQFPAPVRAKFLDADRCLKAEAPADNPASYFPPACLTDSTGSGFKVVVKNGADTCEKSLTREVIMRPGDPEVHVQTRTIEELKQLNGLSCPTAATLTLEGNAAFCVAGNAKNEIKKTLGR